MGKDTNTEFWKILKIEETTDENALYAAYRAELPNYHPEDDPEGFRQLREAYEAALAWLKEKEIPEEDDLTESGLIVRELKDILNVFPRRLDPEVWNKVLGSDACSGIDIQSAVGEKLLVVLMDDYYLPQKIWMLLDQFFGWTAQADRLKEKFPSDYIDYVLNAIQYEERIRAEHFDLSDPNADFNGFIHSYYALNNALNANDLETADQLVAENALNLSGLFNHLDYRVLLVRYYHFKEEMEQAETLVRGLYQEYPTDGNVTAAIANVLLQNNKPQEALPIFEAIIEKTPDHYSARFGAARCYFEMEDYEEAKARCLKLLVEYPFNGYVSSVFHGASERLIPIYEQTLTENPDDQDTIYKLASCYFNEGHYEKSNELVGGTTPDDAHRAKHYELLFDGYMEVTKDVESIKDELLEYLRIWEKNEPDRQRLRYLPQKYQSIGMTDEALEKAEIYLQEFPNDPEICSVQANIYRDRERTLEAHKAIDAGLKSDALHPGLLSEQAWLCESEGDLAEAVRSAELAVREYPYYFELRKMIMRVYYNANQFEVVLAQAVEAEEYGMEDDMLTLYKAASSLSLDRDEEESVTAIRAVLEKNPENAFALEEIGNYELNHGMPGAIDTYSKLIAIDEHPYYYTQRGIAHLIQGGPAEEKLGCADLRKAIEIDPEYPPAWYQLGRYYYYADDLLAAQEHLNKALEFAPDYRAACVLLIKTYAEMGDHEHALETADAALAQIEDEQDDLAYIVKINAEKLDMYLQCSMYGAGLELEEQLLAEEAQETQDEDDRAEVLSNLAYCHYEQGDDDIAETYFNKAAELAPNEAIWRRYGDFLFIARKDYQEAIACYEHALKNQEFYRTHLKLANVYAALGRKSEAKKQYKIALKAAEKELKSSSRPCVYHYIGECLYGLGKYKQAEARLKQAMELAQAYIGCPKHFCYEASFILAQIYREKGDMAKAREYYLQTVNTVPDREYAQEAALFGVERA